MTIAVYKVKKDSMFYLWWQNLLDMSEIRSKEYFRWVHCFKFVNKAKRSRMKVSKRKDCGKDSLTIIILHVKEDHYITNLIAIEKWYLISFCLGYSSSFIPVYEILIKCEPIVKPTRAVLWQKANRCLTILELALKIKASNGLPDREIEKSDTIFRGLWLPNYR